MNKNLSKAKKNKNDEFYTQLIDIKKELENYKTQFKHKIVYCNCDNDSSNFWNYFYINFTRLGLKKLVATHYSEQLPAYKLVYDGIDIIRTTLIENGDFRSPESIELLEESDIVCTNPPFSLFREYVEQLMGYGKQFIIMGNNNAITYKEIFPLIKHNKMWLGYQANKTMNFAFPDSYEKWNYIGKDGVKYGNIPAISWFTNMEVSKRHENIILYKEYNEIDYPKYDNYDAINVDKVKDIPCDYYGVIGVPITFLTKYNSEQFEIIGKGSSRDCFTPTKTYFNPQKVLPNGRIENETLVNCQLVIEVEQKPLNKTYYISNNSKYLITPYTRLLIRRKTDKER